MTSQVRVLYPSCVTSYNHNPIDLCFTVYVLGSLLREVVTQRVNLTLNLTLKVTLNHKQNTINNLPFKSQENEVLHMLLALSGKNHNILNYLRS